MFSSPKLGVFKKYKLFYTNKQRLEQVFICLTIIIIMLIIVTSSNICVCWMVHIYSYEPHFDYAALQFSVIYA